MDHRTAFIAAVAFVSTLASPISPAFAAAPLVKASGKAPIVDGTGKRLYLVDLKADAFDSLAAQGSADFSAQRFAVRHSPKAARAVAAFEKRHKFEHVGMTSFVGNSVAAFLSPGQLKLLLDDPLVVRVTEDTEVSLSALPPLWADLAVPSSQSPFTETSSWGRSAMKGGSLAAPGTGPRVYVVDTGVGIHADLPDVFQRINSTYGISSVGCFAHATHVAGIIGARAGNKGVMGMSAGASMMSISIYSENHPTENCAMDPATLTSLAQAFDLAKYDLLYLGGGRTGVLNISFNAPVVFGASQTLGEKMRNLATPASGYAGILVVQSAGNNYGDACGYAFNPANAADGVLVVGAISRNAEIAAPFSNLPDAGDGPGSNYGACVEIYAPGNQIPSSWGPSGASQLDNTSYDNYILLSGTSMAAPHITGMAAALLGDNPWLAPAQLEAAIQGASYPTGTLAPDGSAIRLTRLSDSAADADLDGIPNHLEPAEGRNAFVKDNDVIGNARLFAMQHFRDFIGNEGDAAGIASVTSQINSGSQPRASAIDVMIGSPAVQDTIAPVVRLYLAYFLRLPDYPGQQFWVSVLRAGNSLETVSNGFAGSTEFQNMYGTLDNGQFVTQLYRNVLRREPEPQGLAFWTDELDSGRRTRGGVMIGFSESVEFRALVGTEVFVTIAYTGLVRREPDSPGFVYWMSYINGGGPRITLLNGLIYSVEYQSRFS